MPYAGVNGQRFYYEISGDGEVVVLLHGALADADVMEAPSTGLASGFRALRIDRRGHGRTTPPIQAPVPLEEEAADVLAILDWFSAPKAHLLAHDEGAEVAIEIALKAPDRVLSMGLLAPTVEGFPWSAETIQRRVELYSTLKVDAKAAISQKLLAGHAFDVVREHEYMDERLREIFLRAAAAPETLARAVRPEPTQLSRLGSISCRTAVFYGDRDDPDRIRCAEAIASAIPGAEKHALPGLSRFLHVEEPRAVMRQLTDFFLPEPEIEP